MSSANDPVAESVTSTITRVLRAHRRDPYQFHPDEIVELEFHSDFPNGFELFAQGENERVVVFESLVTLLGPKNPCEYTDLSFQRRQLIPSR